MKLSAAVIAATATSQHVGGAVAEIITLGPRPYYLVDAMKDSDLKTKLEECANTKTSFGRTDFSIGHRGACMQFPEHTVESYKAAALSGAGIIECDVTFTKDKELICRHSQCDLHTTTDVVLHSDLNAKCTTPFEAGSGVSPVCCASDFTLEEIKTLCGKMDSSGPADAATAEEYVYGGTADWRTDLYQYPCATIPTHKESIQLIKEMNGKFTPELKEPSVEMPFDGFSQDDYAQKMIDEYIAEEVSPVDVWPQSFLPRDVYYWIENTDYGGQAVALDDKYEQTEDEMKSFIDELVSNGVSIVAPPMWMLVEHDPNHELGIVPSAYANYATEQGLDIITWTLERSPPTLTGDDVWYWQTLQENSLVDGDKFALLHVLSQDIGVLGVFSDWPATTTFYGNCMGVGMRNSIDTIPTLDGMEEEGTGGTTTSGEATEVPVETQADDASSSGGRRMLKVATRIVSLGLRLFGI